MFLVRRRNWQRGAAGWVCLPGETVVASFETVEEAEADRRVREAAARSKVNPFECGPLRLLTHLPEPVLRDWLQDAGVDPPGPEYGTPGWAEWWHDRHAAMSVVQREKVWEGLDKLRFFDVAEKVDRPVVYAIVGVTWQYNDQWHYSDFDGGPVTEAYRSRERAEAECRRLNAVARERWRAALTGNADLSGDDGDAELRQFDYRGPGDPFADRRPRFTAERLLHLDDAPFYKVVEVDAGGVP
jgi:hypothetical protein